MNICIHIYIYMFVLFSCIGKPNKVESSFIACVIYYIKAFKS